MTTILSKSSLRQHSHQEYVYKLQPEFRSHVKNFWKKGVISMALCAQKMQNPADVSPTQWLCTKEKMNDKRAAGERTCYDRDL
jgi:hypothetical protein